MRRWLLPVCVYVAISVALTYPVLTHIGSGFPHDAGDPVLNTWILWWNTQRVPLTEAWWNAPMFFPAAGAMALSEVLLGLMPIAAPVQWLTHNPVITYNVVWLLSFPLSGLAAYALALDLTGRRGPALLAGIAFAFAPYRLGQFPHVQVLSYYWAPIALLGLHRYLRQPHAKWLVVFAGGWLMQALSNGYALFHFSLLVVAWIVWFARPWRTALPLVGAWACAVVPVAPLLLKYHDVQSALHLGRDINEIKQLSVDLADGWHIWRENIVWGPLLAAARPETATFPGVTMLIVGAVWLGSSWMRRRSTRHAPKTIEQQVLIALAAIAGLVTLSIFVVGPWALGPLTVSDFRKPLSLAVLFRLLAWLFGPWVRQAWRQHSVVGFYVIAMFGSYLLALGPEPRFRMQPALYGAPYGWLMRLPGFDALRAPARFLMLAVLCQSVLLALALARWSLRPSTRQLLIGVMGAALLADGWVRLTVIPVPPAGPQWQNESAVLEVPPGGEGDFGALYRGMFSGKPLVNGYSGYYPPHYLPLVFAIRDHQYAALQEVARGQPLGIAVNLAASDAVTADRILGGLAGVTRASSIEGWTTFTVRSPPSRITRLGPEIPMRSVWASRHNENIGRLADRRVDTAWGSEVDQRGDEELLIDLGSVQPIGAIVFDMGAYSFGFPRGLEVDASADQRSWATAWSGPTAVLTVHAAITDAGTVPLTIDVGQISARFIRIRQIGAELGIPWWIAELTVHQPAEATTRR
jgi:hypothetical protein